MIARRRLCVAAALAGTTGIAGCDRLSAAWQRVAKPAAPSFHATDITGADFARKIDLPDADGRPRSLADWKGKVTVVFFGYTQCPDVCPATMVAVAEAKRALGVDAGRLQTVLITVDPERDTPEILKAYVSNFGNDVVALRGTPEQTAAVAKEFKIFYAKVPGKAPGSYTMDHTAAAYVFDPEGRVRLFVPYGGDPLKLAADVRTLLAAG